MPDPRILLTAFEPFDDTGLNASLEGCRWFLRTYESSLPVEFAVLPVDYDLDTAAVEEMLAGRTVEVLLHTGQAGAAPYIRVEQRAVNRRYPPGYHPVTSGPGERPESIPIDLSGPDCFESTAPVQGLVEAITATGVPARVSEDAGNYLCNHVFYRSLQRSRKLGDSTRVAFLHVPLLPQQVSANEPSMSAEKIGRAIYAALQVL